VSRGPTALSGRFPWGRPPTSGLRWRRVGKLTEPLFVEGSEHRSLLFITGGNVILADGLSQFLAERIMLFV